MSETAVLACQGLRKSYWQGKNEVPVLADIDLSNGAGERVAVVGASGSGKSTLLHCLGGLDKPDAGEVSVAGQDIWRLDEAERDALRDRSLGFVYQFHHLLPEFTALENVAMPLIIRRMDRAAALAAARPWLEEVGLGHRLSHRPSELSGGERQRAAIARALVAQPACVLMDEPTGNLDRQTGGQIMELLKALNADHKLTIVMVTHDAALARQTDRVVELVEGRVSLTG